MEVRFALECAVKFRQFVSPLVSLALLVVCVPCLAAEQVTPVWVGGGFGMVRGLTVNPSDGSCWIADSDNNQIIHLAANGAELGRIAGLSYPHSVSVNPTDGSCWVANAGANEVLHLAEDGMELWREGGFPAPLSVSVNPADGSCWVAVSGAWDDASQSYVGAAVVHLSGEGTEVWRGGTFSRAYCVSVSPMDGSCWVADPEGRQVIHLAENGAELGRFGGFSYPHSVSVNATDGSCWVADWSGQAVHLSASGIEVGRSEGSYCSMSASTNASDGSVWIADFTGRQVFHLTANGTQLWRAGGFNAPFAVSADSADGSCWLSDENNDRVAHLLVSGYGQAAETMAYSDFERGRSPFATFSLGADARARRKALTSGTPAHSGLYVLEAAAEAGGASGLRLDLPETPTGSPEAEVEAWVSADWSVGESGAFFGFAFSPTGFDPSAGAERLGWEVLSRGVGRYILAGETVELAPGLPGDGWHRVQVRYARDTHLLSLWLDGTLMAQKTAALAAGRSPAQAVLETYSAVGGPARALLDDAEVTLTGYPDSAAFDHGFARLEGVEQVVSGQESAYTLTYGNGYAVLGLRAEGVPLGGTMAVGLRLPSGYSLESVEPAPTSVSGNEVVWVTPLPEKQQRAEIALRLTPPSGAAEGTTADLYTWASLDPAAVTTPLPADPNAADAVWGRAQDTLPQRFAGAPRADLWVRKAGPVAAASGDTVSYTITVGNVGTARAESVVVKDAMPAELGGGTRILGNLASLDPGETWSGAVSGTLAWGLPESTLVVNRAFVPTAPAEAEAANNEGWWMTTIQVARDPNEISVSPAGGVGRGQRLTYTLQCENEGAGTAYGVYATMPLDEKLDPASVVVQPGGEGTVWLDPSTHMLVWEVGTVGAGEGAAVSFMATVSATARRARPITGHATVYFPSVPEETPTNVVANVVKGSFPDIAWDHWALLPVEIARENGVVGGYPDGNYYPLVIVTRDQMAAFIARTLAGGDAYVPTNPGAVTFPDVAADHWAYRYIEYAVAHHIVGGYPDGWYHSEIAVDRGQMAVFIARAKCGSEGDVPVAAGAPTFPDVTDTSPAAWCRKHVEYIVGRGVVGGYPDGSYHPEVTVTRDQMAVFIARAFELPQ